MTDNLVYTSESTKDFQTVSPNRLVRVAAEFAGTLLIVFAIYAMSTWAAIINSSSVIALVGIGTAAAYAAASMSFGRASGGHFNPAVTFAGILAGFTQWLDGVLYIVAQVLGALAAAGLWFLLTPTSSALSMTTWLGLVTNGFGSNSPSATLMGSSSGISFGIKATIAVELLFTVLVISAFFATSRAQGAVRKNHALAVGAAYGVGAMSSFIIDGAGMNPARSTGIAVIGATQGMTTNPLSQLWVFWVVPLVAAAAVSFGFIIRDSVRAQRAETEAAVAALRAEKQLEDAQEDSANAQDTVEESETDEKSAEVPEIVIESETTQSEDTESDQTDEK
ncbi:MIP/aquaporin family protein [Alloscardovia criceti]|uniref:MIP/aquaporin family protein n=1 Tax=Alloscardovia criceti TaxID=356828 RepID=UPI00036644F0|nr:aquaporin [Alloscardovia criceti]